MGFGLLIFGYFLTFTFTISQAYFFADVIGALVMLSAFTKLSEYNRHFRSAAAAGVGFTLLALVSGVLLSMHMLEDGGTVDILLDAAKAVTALVLHVFMLSGTRGIAQGADCEKLAQRAQRNLVMICTYYVLYFVTLLVSLFAPAIVFWCICISWCAL